MFGNPLGGFTLDEHTMFCHNEQAQLAAILSREPRNFVCNRWTDKQEVGSVQLSSVTKDLSVTTD